MQKRFTPKDLTLYGILAVIILMLALTMYQIDRQWLKMAEVERQATEQADDLREMRKSLRDLSQRQFVQGDQGDLGQAFVPEDIPASFQRAHQTSQLPDYSEGDWLVLSFGGKIKTLTPLVATDSYSSDVQDMVLEKLLVYNPDTLQLIGHIAKNWTISDDGLVITYKMRDDVLFSDGIKMTAHDVVFSFEFLMTESIAAPRSRAYYSKIKQVKALDDYTVQFTFIEPYYNSLLLSGTLEIMPKHFYEKYLKTPEKFNQSKGILLGSGPYRLKDPENWAPDKGVIELVRNERYWGPITPPYDRVLWKIIENDSARLTTFRNREIDVYGARPIEYKKLKNDQPLMSRVKNLEYMPPINPYYYIGWNQLREGKKTLFSDPRVRQAMTYLTDRQRIIDEVFLGYGEVAVSPFNPKSEQHDKSITARPYDVGKAKALLKEAGYEDRDGDGVIEDSQGNKFEFDITFSNSSEDVKRIVLMLKDMYAKAGIVLKPKPTEWPVMLEQTDKKNFDVMIIGWTSVVETDLYQIFHSSQSKDNGDNFISYASPDLDKCIEQARSTVDKNKRMPIWHRCEKYLYNDQPYTFLFRRTSLVFADKRIRNLKVTNFGLNLYRAPLETYVPANEQKYNK